MKEMFKFIGIGLMGALVRIIFQSQTHKHDTKGVVLIVFVSSFFILIGYFFIADMHISNNTKMIVMGMIGWLAKGIGNYLFENEKGIVKKYLDKYFKK